MKTLAKIIICLWVVMAGFELYFHGNSNISRDTFPQAIYWIIYLLNTILSAIIVYAVAFKN